LSRLGPGVPVYVVAHSMGNRILTQGLAELLRRRPDAERAFRQVVLASPDIGREEFRQRWVNDLATASVPRFTLYASDQDLPVAVSAWLHGEPRLGSGGADIAVFNRLDSIDASAITREWFGLSHSYFGDNDSVLSDLFVLIHQGTEPDKRPRLRAVSGGKGKYWEFRR
ncbi:MAG: alpha/beta hydrolase, partial [Candidatus Accumulibacter sp.]|nr:alpha/beta hydrolase [Accumulibacter sp.]